MKMRLLTTAILLSCSVFAAKKDVEYQEAVLVDFSTVRTGSSRANSGTVTGEVDDSGNVSGTTHGRSKCGDITTRDYRLRVGTHIYTVRPSYSGKQTATAVASFGYSRFFTKSSVLANQIPGARVLIRTDEHAFWVKLGKRESRFEVIAAK
jgi:hypothetical protein